uniref:Uncharacterized protein n=1 Tax=Glossina pallidipes TaxID=7398 RepID=A0A1A9ZJ73_GLOPL
MVEWEYNDNESDEIKLFAHNPICTCFTKSAAHCSEYYKCNAKTGIVPFPTMERTRKCKEKQGEIDLRKSNCHNGFDMFTNDCQPQSRTYQGREHMSATSSHPQDTSKHSRFPTTITGILKKVKRLNLIYNRKKLTFGSERICCTYGAASTSSTDIEAIINI